jgi:Ser/Thr protein kinase RdoA (MazF antagonist)
MKPLAAAEIQHLPGMLTAAGLCIIHWIVSTYHEDDGLSDDEYLVYLKHGVRLMYSIETRRSAILQMAAELLKQK